MNPIKWPCSARVIVAQWIGYAPVYGFNSYGDSQTDFFFVPHLRYVDQITFHIPLLMLKFTSLCTYHTDDNFNSPDLSSMQDICHI